MRRAFSLLEQLRERRSGIRRRPRCGLALDYSSWEEQLARVARILVHYACGYWLAALEAGARIEVRALTTRVEVRLAVEARAYEVDVRGRLCSAGGALHRLAKRHHLWRARAFTIERF
jgi:hypothetical protein